MLRINERIVNYRNHWGKKLEEGTEGTITKTNNERLNQILKEDKVNLEKGGKRNHFMREKDQATNPWSWKNKTEKTILV